MIKYYVYDNPSDNWSCGYDDKDDAQKDLDFDISYAWSTEATVIEADER